MTSVNSSNKLLRIDSRHSERLPSKWLKKHSLSGAQGKVVSKESCGLTGWSRGLRGTQTLQEIKKKIKKYFKQDEDEEGKKEEEEMKDKKEAFKTRLDKKLPKVSVKPCNMSRAPRFTLPSQSQLQFPGPGNYNYVMQQKKSFRIPRQDFQQSLKLDRSLHLSTGSELPPGMYDTKGLKESIPGGTFAKAKKPKSKILGEHAIGYLCLRPHRQQGRRTFSKLERFPTHENTGFTLLNGPRDKFCGGDCSYDVTKVKLCVRAPSKKNTLCSGGNFKRGKSTKNKTIAAPGRYSLKPIPLSSLVSCHCAFKSTTPRFCGTNTYSKEHSSTRCLPHCRLFDTHDVIQ